MSCMKDDILKQVVRFNTTREAWLIVEKKLATRSRARVILMKEELHNLNKGNLTIGEYVLKVKLLTDELLVTNCLVNEEKKLMYILSGLDEAYAYVFSIITKTILAEKVTIDDAK